VKIRTAIFGTYAAVSAVGFAALMTILLADVRPRYTESVQRTLRESASLLAAVLAVQPPDARSLDSPEWSARFAALRTGRGALRVRVSDAAGSMKFDSDPSALPDNGELTASEPIRVAGRELGWIAVSQPAPTVNAFVRLERRKLVAVASLIALASLVAGWWISAKLTHSIERLIAYANAVRDGRPASPPMSRATEIAALSRAFEEMRATIEGKAYVEHYTQTLTHEIKAPLSAIRGAVELLSEDLPATDRDRFLLNLRTETARIQHIVDRLLELASIEARHGRVELTSFDMRALVTEVLAASDGSATAKGITLKLQGGPGQPMRGERFLLTQAVTNLVQNALEFTPRGGEVCVSLGTEQGRIRVTVEDSGVGVPDYALSRLFERFYSLPRPDTGRKSTGLGLSIVREIARLHGGEVTLDNRSQGGARAALTLPLAAS
jgi:two-component system sensor histidine kinase CreC